MDRRIAVIALAVAAAAIALLLWPRARVAPDAPATGGAATVAATDAADAAAAGAPAGDPDRAETSTASQQDVRVDATPASAGADAATFAIVGTVVGEDGAPFANAIVIARTRSLAASELRTGRFGATKPGSTATDGAGRFRIDHVPAGTVHVYAFPHEMRRQLWTEPWAETEFEGRAGSEVQWQARIDPHPQIVGVARYKNGAPIEGAIVTARIRGEQPVHVVTDKQGRFLFVRLPPEPHDVELPAIFVPDGARPVAARGVWPDHGLLELVASFDEPQQQVPGSVIGSVLDTGNRLLGSFSVTLHDGSNANTRARITERSFRFEDVPPGRWRAIVYSGREPVCASDWIQVRPGEVTDLGAIATEPGGSLLLRVERPKEHADAPVDAYVIRAGVDRGLDLHFGSRSELTVDNLTPGEFRVSCWGEGIAHADSAATVAAGRTSEATLRLRAAVRREVVVEFADERAPLHIRIADDRGAVYFDTGPFWSGPLSRKVPLPLGSFTLSARGESGAEQSVAFAMTSLDDGQPPVRLVVR